MQTRFPVHGWWTHVCMPGVCQNLDTAGPYNTKLEMLSVASWANQAPNIPATHNECPIIYPDGEKKIRARVHRLEVIIAPTNFPPDSGRFACRSGAHAKKSQQDGRGRANLARRDRWRKALQPSFLTENKPRVHVVTLRTRATALPNTTASYCSPLLFTEQRP